jgi:hypothetical protein
MRATPLKRLLMITANYRYSRPGDTTSQSRTLSDHSHQSGELASKTRDLFHGIDDRAENWRLSNRPVLAALPSQFAVPIMCEVESLLSDAPLRIRVDGLESRRSYAET